jgi:hypothetical protein
MVWTCGAHERKAYKILFADLKGVEAALEMFCIAARAIIAMDLEETRCEIYTEYF